MISGQNLPPSLRETLEWLLKVEEFSTARALAYSVLKFLPPDHPETTDFIASVLKGAKFYIEASEWALKTVQFLPHSAEAKFNASKCLLSAAQPEKAEELINGCLKIRPDWVDAKIEKAVFIATQGRVDEGMRILEDLLPQMNDLDPNIDVVRFNLGWHYIRNYEFKKGMKYLGIGRKLRIWGAFADNYTRPKLTPQTSVKGKTVLLCGEGGAGDEMINVRFAQTVKERGGKVVWLVNHPLESLFSRAKGVDRVITKKQFYPGFDYDYWAPAMDLPQLLDLEVHEIPKEPYLFASSKYIKKWESIITQNNRFKVGLRWQGNHLYEQDLMRSIPFTLLEKLLEIPGVDFYSLQRDEGLEELPKNSPVVDLSPHLQTWEDTAAAIHHLDLVISSCTSIPHLTGALGKEVWILSPLNPYYIWALPEDHSPWYEKVFLYRQIKFNSWDHPFSRVYQDLKSRVEATLGGVKNQSEVTGRSLFVDDYSSTQFLPTGELSKPISPSLKKDHRLVKRSWIFSRTKDL